VIRTEVASRTTTSGSILLATGTVWSIDEYLAIGGGAALMSALHSAPEAVIDEIERSGLRGRGGAGFPTATKWRAVRSDPCATKFVVCNAAEGEPGTFKDRWLLRHNPYQVLEGLAIAAHAIGADRTFIAIKRAFARETRGLRRAIAEMHASNMLGEIAVEVVPGPDEYLFGEEKALLEVIEGNDPLPRILPPYRVGLFAQRGSPHPTVVNNVETLANVPHILAHGAEWFRSFGTDASPGTMVFTLSGDVVRPGVYELPLGLTLRALLYDMGGGPPNGQAIKTVFNGASNAILPPDLFDVPLDFEAMTAAGSGLGSGGFVAYDESACIVQAVLAFSRFLYGESCAQCPACKHGAEEITASLERIEHGEGSHEDLEAISTRSRSMSGGARCGLPSGASLLVQSALQAFEGEFLDHLGRPCRTPSALPVPKLVDLDREQFRFLYDVGYELKRPDWTFAASSAGVGSVGSREVQPA
jgi:NADH:ubiquinone oxidoreductase subunit F (NADH-binding)